MSATNRQEQPEVLTEQVMAARRSLVADLRNPAVHVEREYAATVLERTLDRCAALARALEFYAEHRALDTQDSDRGAVARETLAAAPTREEEPCGCGFPDGSLPHSCPVAGYAPSRGVTLTEEQSARLKQIILTYVVEETITGARIQDVALALLRGEKPR